MQTRLLKRLSGVVAIAAFAFILIGCKGSVGQTGTNGTAGPTGPTGPGGPAGPPGPTGSVAIDVTQLTPEAWAALDPKGAVTSVTVSGRPVVNFFLTDSKGNGLKGFGAMTSKSATASLTSYPNLAFALAKLIPEDMTTTNGRFVRYENPKQCAPRNDHYDHAEGRERLSAGARRDCRIP